VTPTPTKTGGAKPPVPLTARSALAALRAVASPERAEASRWFFKTGPGEYGEGDRFLGVSAEPLRNQALAFQALPEAEAVKLLASPWHEARALALLIWVRQYTRGDRATRQRLHRLYLAHTARVNGWDLVDSSAECLVGAHLEGKSRALLLRLADSESLWERRIAVLATFHFIKRGEFTETLRVAQRLLSDPHDLVHKAVGWMLREVGKRGGEAELRGFLETFGARMPRTMLRYAIERFPGTERQRYLAKGPAPRDSRAGG